MSVSQEVIDQTIEFWQTYSGVTLSKEDAREAVQNMSAFMKLIDSWEKASKKLNIEDISFNEN